MYAKNKNAFCRNTLLKIHYRNTSDYSEFRNDSKSLVYLQIKTSNFFLCNQPFQVRWWSSNIVHSVSENLRHLINNLRVLTFHDSATVPLVFLLGWKADGGGVGGLKYMYWQNYWNCKGWSIALKNQPLTYQHEMCSNLPCLEYVFLVSNISIAPIYLLLILFFRLATILAWIWLHLKCWVSCLKCLYYG